MSGSWKLWTWYCPWLSLTTFTINTTMSGIEFIPFKLLWVPAAVSPADLLLLYAHPAIPVTVPCPASLEEPMPAAWFLMIAHCLFADGSDREFRYQSHVGALLTSARPVVFGRSQAASVTFLHFAPRSIVTATGISGARETPRHPDLPPKNSK